MSATPLPPAPFEPVEIPSRYGKAIVAVIIAVMTVVVTALADDVLDPVDLVNVAIAFLTAIGVYVIPNVQDQTVGAWAKALVAVVGTALQAVLPFVITGDVTTQQWLIVFLSAIGALGVGIVPNVNPEKVQAQETAIADATFNRIEMNRYSATPRTSGAPDPVVLADPPSEGAI